MSETETASTSATTLETAGPRITARHLASVTELWSMFAGEPVSVAASPDGATIFTFASEIACLRLYAKYHGIGCFLQKTKAATPLYGFSLVMAHARDWPHYQEKIRGFAI